MDVMVLEQDLYFCTAVISEEHFGIFIFFRRWFPYRLWFLVVMYVCSIPILEHGSKFLNQSNSQHESWNLLYKSQAIIPNVAGKTFFFVFFPIQIHVSSWIKQNGSGSNRSGDLKYRSNARMKYFSAPGTCTLKGCHLRWTKIGLQKFKQRCGIVQLIVRDIRTTCEVCQPSQSANPVNSQKHGNSSKHVWIL